MRRLFGKALKAYLEHIQHGTKLPPQRASLPTRRPGPQRKGPPRDEDYKAFIRQLPCCACHRPAPSEAAHTGNQGGMSMKASDYSCVPLCAECHTRGPLAYHRIGKRAFERLHGVRFASVARECVREWKNNSSSATKTA